MLSPHTAVEITKSEDSLDIWVDANNNGKRDDDDVNIYVTASGGFYTTSPSFKQALDSVIQSRIKQLAVMLINEPHAHQAVESTLRDLALELVVKAQSAEAAAEAAPVEVSPWEVASYNAPAPAAYAAPQAQAPVMLGNVAVVNLQ